MNFEPTHIERSIEALGTSSQALLIVLMKVIAFGIPVTIALNILVDWLERRDASKSKSLAKEKPDRRYNVTDISTYRKRDSSKCERRTDEDFGA
jgi:hypothetical protein